MECCLRGCIQNPMDHHGNFFLVGLPLFYNAAFILLFPLVSGLIQQTGLSARFLALPMVASLSITHALTPPHPATGSAGCNAPRRCCSNPDLGTLYSLASRYGGRASVFILFQEREPQKSKHQPLTRIRDPAENCLC